MFSELYVIRVFSVYFSQSIVKVRPDEHYISEFCYFAFVLALTRRTSTELHGDTSLFLCFSFNEGQLVNIILCIVNIISENL